MPTNYIICIISTTKAGNYLRSGILNLNRKQKDYQVISKMKLLHCELLLLLLLYLLYSRVCNVYCVCILYTSYSFTVTHVRFEVV